jgi:excisionase family DNA binding protein
MTQTKNKQDAAAYIGVSVRTLLRLVDQGKLAHLPKRRPAEETLFDVGELDHYKGEVEASAAGVVSGVVIPDAPGTRDTPEKSRAIARRTGSVSLSPVTLDTDDARDTPEMRERMLAAFEAMASPVRLVDKLTLSLTEASLLSGLSRGHLRTAIGEGKLKAKIVGRGWKVKPDELRAYVGKVLK